MPKQHQRNHCTIYPGVSHGVTVDDINRITCTICPVFSHSVIVYEINSNLTMNFLNNVKQIFHNIYLSLIGELTGELFFLDLH